MISSQIWAAAELKLGGYVFSGSNKYGMSGYGLLVEDEPETTSLLEEEPQFHVRPLKNINSINSADIDNQIEIIKQKWSGTVTDFNDHELTARLEDLTDPNNPDELVVLSIEEIEEKDRPLIQLGAMFLWHIGYRYGPKYPRERFSKISFRRLPKWTEEEIKNAEGLAKEYADFFHTNSTQTP